MGENQSALQRSGGRGLADKSCKSTSWLFPHISRGCCVLATSKPRRVRVSQLSYELELTCRSSSVYGLALACNELSDPQDDVCGRFCVGIMKERGVLRAGGTLSWVVREEHTQKLV